MTSAAFVTPQRLLALQAEFAPPFLVEAALEHRVFDVLDAGPMSLEQLSAATGASHRGLRLLLNALVGLDLLQQGAQCWRL